MPELPEVERAKNLLRDTAKDKKITRVETFEDTIVFAGTAHQEFGQELAGRVVTDAKRYGKLFYLCLDGEGKLPVLHFGMTGMLQVKGKAPMYYRENGRKKANVDEWPPRFTKFVLHLANSAPTDPQPSSSNSSPPPEEEETQIAFLDPRRLARIRLCTSPLTEPPISTLGFDPLLSLPPLPTFTSLLRKRSCPIKALLLDQSFSAGVGNWVADEILYHARVHPEVRCGALSDEEVKEVYEKMVYVAKTAVEVNADDSLFPENWLFKHRWGKGKGKKGKSENPLLLPSGKPATIKWITVGGRTSAYVIELQKLSGAIKSSSKAKKEAEEDEEAEGNESDLTPLAESDVEKAPAPITSTRRSSRKRSATTTTYQLTEVLEPDPANAKRRKSKR